MIKRKLIDTYNGKKIYKHTIVGDIIVSITNLGGRVISLYAPDNHGNPVDVALGFVEVDGMLTKSDYMGATIGRCANRIGGDGFELNGEKYTLYRKENATHLHGGLVGFDKKVFDVSIDNTKNSLTMRYVSHDGEEGYPGNLELAVTFSVRGSSLIIEYRAVSDKDTVFNPTNHTYFNLNGESDGSILDNVLKINADAYLLTDNLLIPTGEVKSVEGTPFDFRRAKAIGRDIFADDEDISIAAGYDHNFCLIDSHFATVYSVKTGIKMDCYTDMPGVQFYAGNFLSGEIGKSKYDRRSGFCLEPQYYPDAIHHPEWVSPILKKDTKYYSKTEYRFSIK